MQPLSNDQFAVIQRFTQLMTEKIAALGLDVIVETNFREYIRLRHELAPASIHNPTYDPDHSTLNLHNALWLRATDPHGRTIAFIAQRIFDSESFYEDILSLRVWHDRGELRHRNRLRVLSCESARWLSGRIGHSGGLWIDPSYRKKNLSGLLDHLSRGLLLKNHWFDHITAFIVTDLARTGIGVKQYGWPRVEGQIEFDFLAPNGKLWTLVFCHMDRAEVLRRYGRWLLVPEASSIEEAFAVRETLMN
jgi:hypothetical protein